MMFAYSLVCKTHTGNRKMLKHTIVLNITYHAKTKKSKTRPTFSLEGGTWEELGMRE